MRRGIVVLTPPEVSFLLSQASGDHTESPLSAKLQLLDSSASEDQLELSEEEVNVLLDLLPPPTIDTPPAGNSVRIKLLQFLGKK